MTLLVSDVHTSLSRVPHAKSPGNEPVSLVRPMKLFRSFSKILSSTYVSISAHNVCATFTVHLRGRENATSTYYQLRKLHHIHRARFLSFLFPPRFCTLIKLFKKPTFVIIHASSLYKNYLYFVLFFFFYIHI